MSGWYDGIVSIQNYNIALWAFLQMFFSAQFVKWADGKAQWSHSGSHSDIHHMLWLIGKENWLFDWWCYVTYECWSMPNYTISQCCFRYQRRRNLSICSNWIPQRDKVRVALDPLWLGHVRSSSWRPPPRASVSRSVYHNTSLPACQSDLNNTMNEHCNVTNMCAATLIQHKQYS